MRLEQAPPYGIMQTSVTTEFERLGFFVPPTCRLRHVFPSLPISPVSYPKLINQLSRRGAHALRSMAHRLPNYLGMHRKRAGFTQAEVAFLLGCRSGAKVSRYERLGREPQLRTVLAYQAIFRVQTDDLFTGIHREVARQVRQRAVLLYKKLGRSKSDRFTARKLEILRAITSRKEV